MRRHGLRPPWITPRDWNEVSLRERENLLLLVPLMEEGVAVVRAAAASSGSTRPTADAGVQVKMYDEGYTIEALRRDCRKAVPRMSCVHGETKEMLLLKLNVFMGNPI